MRDLGASWSLAPWLGASYTLAMGSLGTVAGAVALAAFRWQQARANRPLLERSRFGNRGFVAGLVFGALFFGTVTGVMYVTAPTCSSVWA
ncbi:hypothetical protein [Nonomuraea sp. NPDC049784]|uniref:hypothetical protein n=1 Tax=Nonomuraea sp. NPDC049784 TaxID=3154361 RepID=UPI003411A5C1